MEVIQGRARNRYFHLLFAQYFLRLCQRDGVAFPDVGQSLGHGLNKLQCFGRFLVIVKALHDSNASAPAGQQGGSVCIIHPAYNFSRVHLKVR